MQKLSMVGCLPYKFYKQKTSEYDEKIVNLKGNWYLQGWFQDSRYFQKYESIIRQEIIPKNRIKINHELKNLLQTNNTISVHIRRCDYKKVLNVFPVNYYYNAMECIKDRILKQCLFSKVLKLYLHMFICKIILCWKPNFVA